MSREIKFRAFADFNKFKVMLEEVTVHAASGMCGLHEEAFIEALESTDWSIDDDYFVNKSTGESFDHTEVGVYNGDGYYFLENTAIMQYTGLKDKNGKEIYEGDICWTYEHGIGNLHRVVIFNGGSFCFSHDKALTESIRGWKADYVEVVGNIHENPNLL